MNSYQDSDEISKYKFIKSKTIKHEINRFESVHPCIYEIYDLLDQISDAKISSQMRDYVHCIEDSFINSQEWTLTHGIHEIRLGIIGASSSGKSSLIHRYLTGTYIQNEYEEGGRFKKEVILDGDDSHLMLIRDDGAEQPDYQFSNWIDGVIFVFSLENEESLSILYKFHEQLFRQRNNWAGNDIPCILVGTQDYISESNPRIIDDSKARKLASDLKMSAYYETCATYGLNVEKVFQEAAVSLHNSRNKRLNREWSYNIQPKLNMSSLGTLSKVRPNSQINMNKFNQQTIGFNPVISAPIPPARDASQASLLTQGFGTMKMPTKLPIKSKPLHSNNSSPVPTSNLPSPFSTSNNGTAAMANHSTESFPQSTVFHQHSQPNTSPANQFNRTTNTSVSLREKPGQTPNSQDNEVDEKNNSFASGTPNQIRKIRRRSTLFKTDKKVATNGVGSGRAIPLKQGTLYKRRNDRTLAKERKKKYVSLTSDARLIYHPNLNDYMGDVHGKEIDLSRVTVKIPGVAYRQGTGGIPNMGAGVTMKSRNRASDPTGISRGLKDIAKKQRKKFTSSDETYEFQIVSLDGKQWCFESSSEEDRDEWVNFIEHAILECLQNMDIRRSPLLYCDGHKSKSDSQESEKDFINRSLHLQGNGQISGDNANSNSNAENHVSDAEFRRKMIQEITSISGNDFCADCGQSKPEWASLNLGALICIECSGVHRKLGTHISRVRSLQLDQWSPEWIAVLKAIGNTVANTVWEAAVSPRNLKKPDPSSSSFEKEEWIRNKYEKREFLPPLPCQGWTNQQQLIDAISRRDTRQVILCLAVASEEEINASYTKTDSRAAIHFAAAIGDIVCLQLLIWYKAQIDLKDSSGRNAYFYASMYGQVQAADFLVKNGCSVQVSNQISSGNSQQFNPSTNSKKNLMSPSSSSSNASILMGNSNSASSSSSPKQQQHQNNFTIFNSNNITDVK